MRPAVLCPLFACLLAALLSISCSFVAHGAEPGRAWSFDKHGDALGWTEMLSASGLYSRASALQADALGRAPVMNLGLSAPD
jgi:hypothetical protein